MPRPKKLKVVTPPAPELDDVASLFVGAHETVATKCDWLLPNRIVQNSLSILEGDPESGKSVWLSALVAAITTGAPFFSRLKSKPADVLWLAGEEDPGSMIRPRLKQSGANLKRVHFPGMDERGCQRRIHIPAAIGLLRDAIRHWNLALVILDPLVSHLSGDVDLNHEGQVRRVLDPANHLAIETGCHILGVRHLKKDRSGPRLTHGFGSMAIGAIARSILLVERPDPACERRVLRVVKCSGGQRALPMAFALDFAATVPVITSVVELQPVDDDDAGGMSDAGDRDVREDARRLLKELLEREWVGTSTILQEAAAAGIGERTLRKAKADLRIPSRRIGTEVPARWEWGPLPAAP